MEEPGTHTKELPAVGQRTMGDNWSKIASLTEMVRVMTQDREHRDREIAKERERCEQEREEKADSRTTSGRTVNSTLPRCANKWSGCRTCSMNPQLLQSLPGITVQGN